MLIVIPQHIVKHWRKKGWSEERIKEINASYIADWHKRNVKHSSQERLCNQCDQLHVARGMCRDHYFEWYFNK